MIAACGSNAARRELAAGPSHSAHSAQARSIACRPPERRRRGAHPTYTSWRRASSRIRCGRARGARHGGSAGPSPRRARGSGSRSARRAARARVRTSRKRISAASSRSSWRTAMACREWLLIGPRRSRRAPWAGPPACGRGSRATTRRRRSTDGSRSTGSRGTRPARSRSASSGASRPRPSHSRWMSRPEKAISRPFDRYSAQASACLSNVAMSR